MNRRNSAALPVAAAVLALLAALLWAQRAPIAGWFASSYAGSVLVTTWHDEDDSRLHRAFAAAQARLSTAASLERVPGLRQIHDSVVQVQAASRSEALHAADTFARALVAAFNPDATVRIDTRVRTQAEPVASAGNQSVLAILTYGAPVLGLAALGLLGTAWQHSGAGAAIGVPPWAGFVVAGGVALACAPLVLPGWLVMVLVATAMPIVVAAVIVHKAGEVRRAARWPSAPGHIVRSQTRAVRHKQPDESVTVGDQLDIEYAYSVAGVAYTGRRISLGEIAPGSPAVAAALERYQVGRTGPVFYNPANPREAVLERDPPVSLTAMYAIALGVLLVGFAIIIGFTRVAEVIDWLQPYFPPGAFVPGVLFCAVAGVMVLLSALASRTAALAAKRWPTAQGVVLSSTVEPRRVFAPGGGGRMMQVWAPLVTFSYRVGKQEYHGSRIAFGPDVAGSQALAEATAARYPAGSAVTVHYDPATPALAVLETQMAFGWISLVLAVALLAGAVFFSRAWS